MKKTTMKRESYDFNCNHVTKDIYIPDAKEIAKLSNETKKMDELGRKLLQETQGRLQYAVENGIDNEEIFLHTEDTGLSKFAIGQVIRAWKKYMKNRGYKTYASLECENCWSLCFSWEIKE